MRAAGQTINFQPIPVFPAAMYSCLSGYAQQASTTTSFQLCDSNIDGRFCALGTQLFNWQPTVSKYFSAQAPTLTFQSQDPNKSEAPSNDDSIASFPVLEIVIFLLLVVMIPYVAHVITQSAWESRDNKDEKEEKTKQLLLDSADKK